MYDVIIIGAGPTGSSAAKKLADSGYSVLMVERFKMPRNKSCSGILIKKSLDLIKDYFNTDVPEHAMCSPTDNRGMIFTNDKGQEYKFEQAGLNIWRSSFDHWLAKQAVLAGVEMRDETSVLSCEEQNGIVIVKMKGKTEYYEESKIVIACDGAAGITKRKLTHVPHDFITTYQTFSKGSIDLDEHYFYAYLQPQLSEYDAWFNIKDDYLIFGIAVKNTNMIKHYYSAFINYMNSQHNAKIEKQEKEEKWLMPRIIPGCPINYGIGRVLFAGEAAGFLNPMGEGISAGLECGYAAADAIVQTGDFDIHTIYSVYKNNTNALKAYMERQWNFVARIAEPFKEMGLQKQRS